MKMVLMARDPPAYRTDERKGRKGREGSRGSGRRRAAGAAGRQTQAVRVRERMAVRLRAFVPGPESACVRRFATPSPAATAAHLIATLAVTRGGQLCDLSGLCVHRRGCDRSLTRPWGEQSVAFSEQDEEDAGSNPEHQQDGSSCPAWWRFISQTRS